MSLKAEKVLRFHLLLLPVPKLTCKVNLNILIREDEFESRKGTQVSLAVTSHT